MKVPNTIFHGNLSSGRRNYTSGQTHRLKEGQTNMTDVIGPIRDCGNAPKNGKIDGASFQTPSFPVQIFGFYIGQTARHSASLNRLKDVDYLASEHGVF